MHNFVESEKAIHELEGKIKWNNKALACKCAYSSIIYRVYIYIITVASSQQLLLQYSGQIHERHFGEYTK